MAQTLASMSIAELEDLLVDLNKDIASIREEKTKAHAAMERKVIAEKMQAAYSDLPASVRDAVIEAVSAQADAGREEG